MIPPLPLAASFDSPCPAGPLSPLPRFPASGNPPREPEGRPSGLFDSWRRRASRLTPLDAPARFAEPGADEPPLPPLDEPRGCPPAGDPDAMDSMPGGDKDFTDDDLAEVIGALIPPSHFRVPFPTELPEFEVILRSAFRRALAEHTAGPFERPNFVQRCRWRFDALLTSRSYEEILDEKTRRFRIEEVYLFDPTNLALISFASIDPARHASARKVGPTAHRLAAEIRGADGGISPQFTFENGLLAFVRPGEATLLAALIRGAPDALAAQDLDHALRRIEQCFADELAAGYPLLHELQPLLEECLLIHSPIAPPAI